MAETITPEIVAVDGGMGEVRVATLDESGLLDLHHFRSTPDIQDGDIFLARVTKASPGLDGAFLSLGGRQEAFLPVRKARSRPHEGELIPVRVRFGTRPGKRITVSRDLGHAPASIVQPETEKGGKPRLVWRDANRWIETILGRAAEPTRLPDVRVEDADLYRALRSRCLDKAPVLAERLTLDRQGTPLFERLGIADEIDALFAPALRLPGGGSLKIEETAAGTAIDVDTDAASGPDIERIAQNVNLEAARLIARQLRLRRTGGLVFIDFVTMRAARSRKAVLAALDEALATTATPWERTGLSRFGVVELNGPRSHTALMEEIGDAGRRPGPNPATSGHAILRQLEHESRNQPGKALVVECNPATAGWLRETLLDGRPLLDLACEKFHVQVILEPRPDAAAWSIHAHARS